MKWHHEGETNIVYYRERRRKGYEVEGGKVVSYGGSNSLGESKRWVGEHFVYPKRELFGRRASHVPTSMFTCQPMAPSSVRSHRMTKSFSLLPWQQTQVAPLVVSLLSVTTSFFLSECSLHFYIMYFNFVPAFWICISTRSASYVSSSALQFSPCVSSSLISDIGLSTLSRIRGFMNERWTLSVS